MITDEISINTVDDILDLIVNVHYQANCDSVIIERRSFNPHFFDLKTGLAGEMLQKVTTYKLRMGIVGDFTDINSKSFHDFIYESNKNRQIVFTDTMEKAMEMLDSKRQ
ncbi:MAG: DUF4180 domain-containing protein [Bacteroidales bacterium]|nr:DUF4180 domain-containing protein [Bacteroidales bacterium]